MKITRRQLHRIINEEMRLLKEEPGWADYGGTVDVWEPLMKVLIAAEAAIQGAQAEAAKSAGPEAAAGQYVVGQLARALKGLQNARGQVDPRGTWSPDGDYGE